MTEDELISLLDNNESEYLEFERIEKPLSKRPDLHALLLLDSLVGGDDDLIVAAEHGEFFVGVTPEVLAPVITEQQAIDLVRCGVRYSSQVGCLAVLA